MTPPLHSLSPEPRTRMPLTTYQHDDSRARVYLEPVGEPAFERLRGLISGAKADDELAPVTVVTPTSYAGLSLRRRLSRPHGLINVRFMTLARLAEYLGAPEAAKQKKTPLTPAVAQAAVNAAGRSLDDSPLAAAARHTKTQQSAAQAFRLLDRLEGRLDEVASSDDLRRHLVAWYRGYQGLLGDYYGTEELTRLAADAVRVGGAAEALRDIGAVVFYLVHDFSPAEAALAEALGEVGSSAVVLGMTIEERIDDRTRRTAGLFDATAEDGGTTPGLGAADHLVSAPDAHEEVRQVVRRIVGLAGDGTPFHRIAVLYRQAEPYAALLRLQLDQACIPIAGPDAARLRDTPAGKLVTLLLRVFETDLSRETIMTLIAETPFRTGKGQELASQELPGWEQVSAEAGVVGGAGDWKDRLSRYEREQADKVARAEADGDSPGWVARLESLRRTTERLRSFVEELARRAPPESGSWGEYAKWAARMLEDYAHDPNRWPTSGQSYDRVKEAIESLADADKVDALADVERFTTLLDGLLDQPAGRVGATGGGVFTASIAAAQGMTFDTVFIVGMADGSLPPKPQEDALLPDALRERLGGRLAPAAAERSLEERRLYLLAHSAAPKRFLSYSRTDPGAQRGQHPSPWFLEAAGRRAGEPVFSSGLAAYKAEPWLSIIESPEAALAERGATAADVHDFDLASVRAWRAGRGRLDDHPLAQGDGALGRALRMEAGVRSRRFTEWDGRLESMAGSSRLLQRQIQRAFSPTRLERWATCPLRYFFGDILGLSKLERPERILTISALDRGSLVHEILEQFVDEQIKSGTLPGYGKPWGPEHKQRLDEIAEAAFQRTEAQGVTGRPLLWAAAREDILADLDAFLEEDSKRLVDHDLAPLGIEQAFGMDDAAAARPMDPPVPGEGWQSVELTLKDNTKLRFHGFIDRVDVDAAGSLLWVIDYKTGSANPYKEMGGDPLDRGRRLQLPVYALAARRRYPGVGRVRAGYWFVSARAKFEMKNVALRDVQERFSEVAATIVSGIRQGVVPAHPGKPGWNQRPENCTYCDFDRICPSNRERIWERKRDAPGMEPYIALLGGGEDEP